jgi:hypothetical protein
MVCNVTLAPVQATLGTVPAFPAYIGTDLPATSATASSSGKEDADGKTYTKYTYEYVNGAGSVVAVGSPARNFVRYCEYPGHRLFKKIKFDVNSNPLTSRG